MYSVFAERVVSVVELLVPGVVFVGQLFMLYLSSVGLRKRDANAIRVHPSGVFCSSAATSAEREASNFTRASSLESYF